MALASPNPLLPELKKKLERGLGSAQFAQEAVKNPITFSRQPLPPTVNRFPLQYTPSATADDQTLVYTARKGITLGFDEDIYITRRNANGQWEAPTPISLAINTTGNEGTTSLSADGRTLVFAACDRNPRSGCDIFISHRSGDIWSEPVSTDSANSISWDSHPCLSADGNTLIFVSSRPGGVGRNDIYVARRWPNGKWGRAVNAGPAINTEDDDIMPFLHPNGRTLFFGSRGHVGMGGSDLFMADRTASTTSTDWTAWSTPRNLGYPLNTKGDETSIFVSPDGQKAYYCVDDLRGGEVYRSILYEFGLGESLNLTSRSYLAKGTVREAGTGKLLGANVDLVDNATGQVLYSVEADPKTGHYLMVLPQGNRYGLTVYKPGYLFQSRFFDFADAAVTGSVELDFELEALKQGAKTVLHNVFFPSGSAELLPESRTELVRVAILLKTNPRLKVEVAGYTDNVGKDADNLLLSKRRAQAVRDFLVTAGTTPLRLVTQGYGAANPAAANDTDENRAKNRRIEFSITGL